MLTAAELCMRIAASSETANSDLDPTNPMPPCAGPEDVPAVLEALRRGGLTEVADLLTSLEQDDITLEQDGECEDPTREIVKDMQLFLEANRGATKEKAVVSEGCYRGDATTVAEIAMSFYDLVGKGHSESVRERVETLQVQAGIVLSPMMKAVLSKSQQS